MITQASPFEAVRRAYAWRFGVAAICTALAAGCTRALFAGLVPVGHWIEILMLACVMGAATLFLGIDVTQRWYHLRQLRLVEDASRPFGFSGPAANPVSDLKRPARRKTTGVH